MADPSSPREKKTTTDMAEKVQPSSTEQQQPPILDTCSHCAKQAPSPNEPLPTCVACGIAKYCDATCQRQAWPVHKLTCTGRAPVCHLGILSTFLAGLFPSSHETPLQDLKEQFKYMAAPFRTLAEKLANGAKTKSLVSTKTDSVIVYGLDVKWGDIVKALSSRDSKPRFVWMLCTSADEEKMFIKGFYDLFTEAIKKSRMTEIVMSRFQADSSSSDVLPSVFRSTPAMLVSGHLLTSSFAARKKTAQLIPTQQQICFTPGSESLACPLPPILHSIPQLFDANIKNALPASGVGSQSLFPNQNPHDKPNAFTFHILEEDREAIRAHIRGGEATPLWYSSHTRVQYVQVYVPLDEAEEDGGLLYKVRDTLYGLSKKWMREIVEAVWKEANVTGVILTSLPSLTLAANVAHSKAMMHLAFYELDQAEDALDRCIQLRLKIGGALSQTNQLSATLEAAAAFCNLGYVRRLRLRPEEATKAYGSALTLVKSSCGVWHPLYATVLFNQAVLIRSSTKDFHGAKRMHEECLLIRRKVLAPDDPDIAISLGHIAELYKSAGDYWGASRRYVEAIDILHVKRTRLVQTHETDSIIVVRLTDELIAMRNNLALVFLDMTDYEDARALLEESLSLVESQYRVDHPAAAIICCNLSEILRQQNDWFAASQCAEKAGKIITTYCGPDPHPLTCAVLQQHGHMLLETNQIRMGKRLLEANAKSRLKMYPKVHPAVASALHALAVAYNLNGQTETAKTTLEECIKIKDAVLGSYHTSMIKSKRLFCGIGGNNDLEKKE